jgi:hypothetical protein
MVTVPISGSPVADIVCDERDFTYVVVGLQTVVSTVTYKLRGQIQAVVTYTYDGSGNCTKEIRTNT